MFVIKDYHVDSQRSVNIHQANNLTVSGVSGINTYIYEGDTDHVLVIDPSGLSGVLRDSYTDLSLAVSGYFNKASGNLHSMIYDSGVYNYGRAVAYTDLSTASGHAESGFLQKRH